MNKSKKIELRKNETGSFKIRLTLNCGELYSGVRKFLGLRTGSEATAIRRSYMVWIALVALGHYGKGRVRLTHLSADPGYVEWDSAAVSVVDGMWQVRLPVEKRQYVISLSIRDLSNPCAQAVKMRFYGADAEVLEQDARIMMQCLQRCATEWQGVITFDEAG